LYTAIDSLLGGRLSEKLINLSLFHVMRGGPNATSSSMEVDKMFFVVNTQHYKFEACHDRRQNGPFRQVWGNQYRHIPGV
jgi:hypothetical protein